MITALTWGAKICVDPGHGGTDSGATGCGLIEKTANLSIATHFKNYLNADTNDAAGGGSWVVVMTRTTDVYVSLSGRCAISNDNYCERFMSTHNNACLCGNGTETFSYSSTGNGADLRNKVQYRILSAWGLTNRGNKVDTVFTVLKNTNCSAELTECGFIDYCATDAVKIGSDTARNAAGLAQLYAIQTHYGYAAYKPGTSLPTYTLDNSSTGFTASANWTTGTSATDKYGTNYRYRSTAALSDAAQWSINVGTAGTYKIQAWWPAGTNRSATAPFICPSGTSVSMNQQANGGKWNLIRSESLGTGAKVTKLSCWTTTGYVVMADAVRYGP